MIQGVTGALLGYEREIRNWLGDGAIGRGERQEMSELVAEVAEGLGEGRLQWVIYFEAPSEPVWIRWERQDGEAESYLVDPRSGEILSGSTEWHRRYETVLALHRNLALGRSGQVIMGISSLMLAVLLVTGLVLQVKRCRSVAQVLGFGGQKRGSFWIWLHGSFGTWMTPVLLILALTGPIWSFSGYRALIGMVTQSEPRYGNPPVLAKEQESTPPDLEAILAGARPYMPETGAMRLIVPRDSSQPARFEWAPEEAPYENFRSRVWLHARTGELVKLERLSDYTRAEKVIRWAYPVHIGKWGGRLTQFLHVAAAITLVGLLLSGAWLYWKRLKA